MFFEGVAIDPLAMIFTTRVYLILMEKLHPRVPLIDELRQAASEISAEEKAFALARVRALRAYADAVEEALGG